MPIKFGPAGLGSVKDAIDNLEMYHKLGLRACEIAFTYGVYIKRKEDALKISKAAEKLNIDLSIHAPYYINLNSSDKEKLEASKSRILKCLEIGTWLKAKKVVFHPGYYGKQTREETFEQIKSAILEIKEKAKENKFTPELAPETSGKVNVFGSIYEIAELAEQTKTSFCIDFAHILARYKTYNFDEVKKEFKNHKSWHIHFSGIEHGDKGEKYHKQTSEEEWKKLLAELPKDKKIIIINESPSPVKDAILGLSLYEK